MNRVLEQELMDDDEQVEAYAEADFEAPHNQFIQRLKIFVNKPDLNITALDLGCGPGDISRRFVETYPLSKVDAVDGSVPMIMAGQLSLPKDLKPRVNFILGVLPNILLPHAKYELIFSNSLLHHLPDPQVLWQVIKKYAQPETGIIIMDLLRPESTEAAKQLVKTYADNEPPILQQDFYNSLLAAFTLDEIKAQLKQAGLHFLVEQISDRHVFISGIMP
jgi:ubiquinone/menaquinone biosynthesis C-methylase UbiE